MTAVSPPLSVQPPASRRRRRALPPWALAACLLAGQAMASLDTAIVNVGGPSIRHDLHLSDAGLQLAVYTYVLAYAVALIIGARLGGRHGCSRLFACGIALFTASSLACGLAPDATVLVAARTVQGLGAALLVPQVLSLLQTTFDGDRRRRALNLYGMVLALGVAAGQILGGILVTANLFGTGWRPIFLVNVPVGLTVLACSAGRFPAATGAIRRGLDLPGAAALAFAVLALVAPLTFGADAGWPWWCWPLLGAGVLGLALFGLHERRVAASGRDPLVPPALLAARPVRVGLFGIFTLMGCYGGLLFTTAVYLQTTLHDNALRSGLTFAAYAAGFATASLTWSRLPAARHRHVPTAAFAVIAAATALLAWTVNARGWPPAATILLAVAGAGHGAGFGALVQRTVGGAAPEHAASISGVLSTVNQLAIVTGIAAAGALFASLDPSSRPLPAMSVVLLAVAAIELLTGAVVAVAARSRPIPP